LRHVRESWVPTLLDRFPYHRWAERGETTLQERANQKVQEIIKNHRAEPLSADVVAGINAVIEQK
jgi:trimethylamine:corrinoid methyltransferase-like protein